MKNFLPTLIFISALVCFIIPTNSHASEINLNIGSSTYDLQDTFMVDVYIDTQFSNVNAIETYINFDPAMLQIVETIDSDSTVNFWIEKEISAGALTLSGIIPGGFRGESGKIISILFETIGSGQASIELQGASVFLNDGLGTREDVSGKQLNIDISKKVSLNIQNKNLHSSDKYPPESFKPEISRSTSLFDNKWFLVFATVDKNSGISHYLIKEASFRPLMFFKRWSVVESPYLLRDQDKTSFIAIKAVDKAGNEMVQKVHPENSKTLVEKIIATAITVVVLCLGIYLLKKLVGRLKRFGD